MKKNDLLLWIVGLCAFVSFVAKGLLWAFGKFGWSIPGMGTALSIANLILLIATFIAGILWTLTFKNKKVRIAFTIILCIFAAMCILGLYW